MKNHRNLRIKVKVKIRSVAKKIQHGHFEEDENSKKNIERGGFEGGMGSMIYSEVSPEGFSIGGGTREGIMGKFDFSDYL